MEIVVAKHAGFCFGVNKAVKTVYGMISENKLCTYGPITHNSNVIKELNQKGVRVINDINEAEAYETVVIRSHGVPPEVYEALNEKRIKYIDCTCVDVRKIHNIVSESVAEGRIPIIIGDGQHPEVIGEKGYAGKACVIFGSTEDAETYQFDKNAKYAVVAQTTFARKIYEQIIEYINKLDLDVKIYDTMCRSTIMRQAELDELSKTAGKVIVLGDRNSSNTVKLYELSKKNCANTFLVETIKELQLNIFDANDRIIISAGASTPPAILKEAVEFMSELENTNNNDQTFQEMLDESFVTLHTGEVVKGTVIQVSNGEVSVNLGYKSDGIITRSELSDDPDVNPAEMLKPGDVIDVFVIRVNDGEGNVLLSKKKIDAQKRYDEIEQAYNEKTPLKGKVVEIVKGGLIALVKGTRIFVPSSQISNRYVEDLAVFKGKEFNFNIIEFNKSKRRIVAGRKDLAQKELGEAKERVFSTIEAGGRIEGVVNRVVDFGAFVDLGGVDGLIHVSELSWGRVKKVSDVLKEGDKVTVTVLDINKDKGRISLSLKDINNDPWKEISVKYPIGTIVTGKVVRMVSFGAFVELEDGVDGLVHISQIAHKHIQKPEDVLEIGMVINAKVTALDIENKKISLSIKDADDSAPEGEPAETQEATTEEFTEAVGESI